MLVLLGTKFCGRSGWSHRLRWGNECDLDECDVVDVVVVDDNDGAVDGDIFVRYADGTVIAVGNEK